ncbi:hypothetical protein A2U01_0110296, partial [Trifolium medium]|nr:hypothetical protein [Trifolium medium]
MLGRGFETEVTSSSSESPVFA